MEAVQDYALLRAYSGGEALVYVTGRSALPQVGISGFFFLDQTDSTSPDNGGTVIVGAGGRRWKRQFVGAVDVRWFGAKGDGVTDDSIAIQAAIDQYKGRDILVSAGRFVHAGILLAGSSYDGTTIVCEGELLLKTRPTSGTTNYQGGWIGLILEDTDRITINYRGDGNRAMQPVEEHCHLVAIAGGNTIHFPTFEAREVRGDGIYINQVNFQSASGIPTDLAFGEFSVINTSDDGRNAMSIISASRVSIANFKSIRVGGMVGITQPGGLDLEPNYDFQTIDSVHVGSAYIDTAGNFGFQAIGQARTILGGNIRSFSAGKVHVISRGTTGALTPVAFRHCSDVSVDCLVEFRVPQQQNHVAVYIENARSLKISGVSIGGGVGARVGYGAKVQNLDLKMVCRDYIYAAIQTVLIENSKVELMAQTSVTPLSWMPAALYVRTLTFTGLTQINVDYTINCPKVATTGVYGCFNETNNKATFENVRFIDGDLRGYATQERAFGGFGVGVKRINVAGVSDGTAPPTAGAWDVGNEVRNSVPAAGGVLGWVCTAAGAPGTWKAFGNIAA